MALRNLKLPVTTLRTTEVVEGHAVSVREGVLAVAVVAIHRAEGVVSLEGGVEGGFVVAVEVPPRNLDLSMVFIGNILLWSPFF